MESIKKQHEDGDTISTEDKCDNCGNTNADKYWDFKDKSVLCNKCYEKIGNEWENRKYKIDNAKKIKCDICDRDFDHNEALEAHNNSKHKKINHNSPNKKLSVKIIAIVSAISLIVLIVVLIGIFGQTTSNYSKTNANVVTTSKSNIVATQNSFQTATLEVLEGTYILKPSVFKKDIPVRIIANYNDLPGCSKSVTIPAFGVQKRVSTLDNVIIFTPTKTGTFKIACSMDMYRGTFIVE
jgi:hypothetical protein